MSAAHAGLEAARQHGVLAIRPNSDVFHVYVGPMSRRTGRIPRGARSVANCRTSQLRLLERDVSVLDLQGRVLCGRCSTRLASTPERVGPLVSHDDFKRVYRDVTLADLVVAIAMCTTVEESHRVGYVTGIVHGPAPVRRPAAAGYAQARYDVEQELHRRRRELTVAAMSPEEQAAEALRRDLEVAESARIQAAHKRDARIARATDRRNRGQWLAPHERELLGTP